MSGLECRHATAALPLWIRAQVWVAATLLLTTLGVPHVAYGESAIVRFSHNVGLGYLPLYVMREQKLVEQQAHVAGLGEVETTYQAVPGPGPINDALISGNTDFGIAGIQGMIIAWDKTRGRMGIKGLAPIGTNPAYFNTNNPDLHGLSDLSDRDRIALPTVKVASQAYALEYASEKLYGPGQYDHFDHLTVSLGHPDALVALMGGGAGITAHFATEPYHLIELQNPKIHTVTSDEQIYGQRLTSTAMWTTTRFHDANPALCKAVLKALEIADAFIVAHPDEAARIFIRVDGGHFPLELVERALSGLSYGTSPTGIASQAGLMKQVGAIGTAPANWKELFFSDVYDRDGN